MRKLVCILFLISTLIKAKLKTYVKITKSLKGTFLLCSCNMIEKNQKRIKIIIPKRIIKRIERKKVIQRRVEKKRKTRKNLNIRNIKNQKSQNSVL